MENEKTAPAQELAMKADTVMHVPMMPMQLQGIDYMIELAITGDAGIDKLEKLLAMKERYDLLEEQKRKEAKAEAAKDAFTAAMVQFKAEDIEIYKDALVDFTSTKGRTTYMHASIGNVCRTIVKGLAKHGFSHNWIPEQQGDGTIKVTCVLTHEKGHSESISLFAPPDMSGNKNTIQGINSTTTYLERYTLLKITGLATMDQEDDDGRGYGGPAPQIEHITEEQSLILDAKITDNDLNREVFTRWLGKFFPYTSGNIDLLSAEHYEKVVEKLDETIKHKQDKDAQG
jgi:hypothetical protein